MITVTALLLTPSFSDGGNQNQQLRNDLRLVGSIYNRTLRDIQTNLRENLRSLPRETGNGNFDNTLQQISGWGYDAWYDEKEAYYSGVQSVRSILQGTTLDVMDAGSLPGRGSCADRAREEWLWEQRSEYAKWLEMTLRRTRWELEEFNSQTNRFERIPVNMSVLVFPNPRDLIMFTTPPVKGPSSRVNIGGIVAASYTGLGQSQATASACVFGISMASATVDVTADGPGGPFNAQTSSDTDGTWNVCIPGLREGYYQFGATEGANSATPRELALQLRFNF